MSNDPSGRRILPQSSQMGSFSFAPQQTPQTQKNYVFVDEHNRHKRLKVMRACEGCRRRKIKCDAATTNTWPCSACVRLKLHCVRPNGFDESESPTISDQTAGMAPAPNPNVQQPVYDASARMFPNASPGAHDAYPSHSMMQNAAKTAPPMYQSNQLSASTPDLFQAAQYGDVRAPTQQDMTYAGMHRPVNAVDPSYGSQNVFPAGPIQTENQQNSSPGAYSQDSYQADLADLLGSLKVNEAGTAPYLRNKASFRRGEEPLVEDEADDFKAVMPPMSSGRIRIPPALMPDEETAQQCFDAYFTNIHPYLPVLSKPLFYQQWNTNREAISPLILEAIFAIGGRLADEPVQGKQWLALAASHADAFMDIPRLSTLQALLILLKARECAPKKGYYYRSWMSIVQCVQMGKELGLDEHYADHQAGKGCESTELECRMKTRVWQAIFILEVMIGSPQGRTDLAVDIDDVDFRVPKPIQGYDNDEYLASRNFTYLARLVRNISRMNSVYARIKKKKEWGVDPEFVQLNPSLSSWLAELPGDLSITFPPDISPPWIPSSFVGNIHTYHYLSFILLHRPQLAFCDPVSGDGKWKHHMMICYSSAKAICRLQEAVLNTSSLTGLGNMLRGFSFPIYCALSCVVLHLVAMTSPDPDLNTDARDFFQRQMRLVEKVMSAWPMPEVQRQVNAVREAFSANIRKPFELKPSFPYGSPTSSAATPPRSLANMAGAVPSQSGPTDLQAPSLGFTSHASASPISAGPTEAKGAQAMMMFTSGPGSQPAGMAQQVPMSEPPAWNPTRIFENWKTSFEPPMPQPNMASQMKSSSSSPPDFSNFNSMDSPSETVSPGGQTMPNQQFAPQMPAFITPAMWQESVASVYEVGMKRAWGYDAPKGQ